ncbi:GAF domain-containing protein [Natronobacillus azotifigens]|uniref:GAF domain-containing protein n=1 Tax=Natronobacillus azotifigens TaxID=472978 RepID=A0A9J6RCH4_9BACI|nr:GAF domain-containing protein [Natronobacillus azotifigens]MCZ0703213.1 GAF domain-containing protein [Natronobacillus azotifigens]
MFETKGYSESREKNYQLLLKQLEALIEDETDQIANLSNSAALLNQFLTEINWVGFYLLKDNQLVLGPFQGLPACVRIQVGKGVCGTAVSTNQTQRIANVHEFPGHIACDAASQSEIVVPVHKNGEIYGVLDIDSPIKDRFDQLDQEYLEQFVVKLEKYL